MLRKGEKRAMLKNISAINKIGGIVLYAHSYCTCTKNGSNSSKIFVEKKWTQTRVQKKYGRIVVAFAKVHNHGQLLGREHEGGLERLRFECQQRGRKNFGTFSQKKILVSFCFCVFISPFPLPHLIFLII